MRTMASAPHTLRPIRDSMTVIALPPLPFVHFGWKCADYTAVCRTSKIHCHERIDRFFRWMGGSLDLHQLRVFHSAVSTGSFTQAGRELRLSQSTVSQHIKRLEEELAC